MKQPIFAPVHVIGRPETRTGYVLPFNYNAVEISQGYNGGFSHRALQRNAELTVIHDDRFSLDFVLPLGTEVVAAKAGKVYRVADFFETQYTGLDLEEGMQTFANFIYLLHKDGSLTLYSHLANKSVKVEKGQEVKQGQVLAKTGRSGWIGPVPHLHFAALDNIGAGLRMIRRTFPVTFDNYAGPLEDCDLEEIVVRCMTR